MIVREINVQAGRSVPHPTQPFRSFKISVAMRAMLNPNDNPEACVLELQQRVSALCDIAEDEYMADHDVPVSLTPDGEKALDQASGDTVIQDINPLQLLSESDLNF
jgi:hypothetical protein